MTRSAILPCTLSVSLSRRKSNFSHATHWLFPVTTIAALFICDFLPSYPEFVLTQDKWEMLNWGLESPLPCSLVTVLDICLYSIVLSQQLAWVSRESLNC